MTRRSFTASASGLALGGRMAAEPAHRSIIELRWLRMRTNADDQMKRTANFLRDGAMPALKRAGIGPMGFFASVIAPESPFILVLASFPSIGAMETIRDKEEQDPAYRTARAAYNGMPGLGYERLDSSLLRCFESVPAVEAGADDGQRPARIFELRVYESNNASTLARKVKMFNDAEIAIFRRLGMRPVFFGETIVGANMPNLTYMLAFDSLAHRESAWKSFGSDAEWKELSGKAGNSDAELVSKISNMILRPLPFSPIK